MRRVSKSLLLVFFTAACARFGYDYPDYYGEYLVGQQSQNWQVESDLTATREKSASDSTRAENAAIVSLAMPQFEPGKYILSRGKTPTACGPGSFLYWIRNEQNRITLRVPVKYIYDEGASEAVVKRELGKCDALSRKVWLRYGLDVTMYYTDDDANAWKIHIHPRTGRSDSLNYFIGGQDGQNATAANANQGITAPQNETGINKPGAAILDASTYDNLSTYYCATYVHEVGHLLGLPDEYRENGTCRDDPYAAPETEFPTSIMKSPFDNIARIDFMPRHVRQIVDQSIKRLDAHRSGSLSVADSFVRKSSDPEDTENSEKMTRMIWVNAGTQQGRCTVELTKYLRRDNKKLAAFSMYLDHEDDQNYTSTVDNDHYSFMFGEDKPIAMLTMDCSPKGLSSDAIRGALNASGITLNAYNSPLGRKPYSQLTLLERQPEKSSLGLFNSSDHR